MGPEGWIPKGGEAQNIALFSRSRPNFFFSLCGLLVELWPRFKAMDWVGHLLGREHDSSSQSGVEDPRLSKQSLSRLHCCFCALAAASGTPFAQGAHHHTLYCSPSRHLMRRGLSPSRLWFPMRFWRPRGAWLCRPEPLLSLHCDSHPFVPGARLVQSHGFVHLCPLVFRSWSSCASHLVETGTTGI